MDWITIVNCLLGSGGIAAILTIPSVMKRAKSEAQATIEERWKSYATEIHHEVDQLKDKVYDLENTNRVQFEVIMTAFGCKLKRGDEECCVLVKYNEAKENEK